MRVKKHLIIVSEVPEHDQKEIINHIMYLSERKVKSQQINMANEIEVFIEKNMMEMHKALEELRASFEEEIKSLDGIFAYNFRASFCRSYQRFKRGYGVGDG
jgi:hypothetical protein